MTTKQWFYPSIIYLIGMAIVPTFALTYPNYIAVGDVGQEYWIYTFVINGGDLQSLWDWTMSPYALQSTCLSVTLFPALLQKATGIEPLLLYKLYTYSLLPLLPVVVYFIAKRFMSNLYAFLATTFFIGQVCFLHAPAMTRSNIASIFFALALLVILHTEMRKRVKFPILFILSTGIILSHYSTAYVSLLLLGATGTAVLLWQLIKKVQSPYRNSILVTCLSLMVGITVWHGLITHAPWDYAVELITSSTSTSFIPPGDTPGDTPGDPVQEYEITDIASRDKITQAAFGIKNPNGDTEFNFNWTTFVLNWLVIILMSYGLLITLIRWHKKKAVPLEYLILSIMGYITIAGTVILPYVSRAYGIERTYYQMLVFLGIYFIFGCADIAKRLRLKPYMLIIPVLIPYFYYTYVYGIIHSTTGR